MTTCVDMPKPEPEQPDLDLCDIEDDLAPMCDSVGALHCLVDMHTKFLASNKDGKDICRYKT